MPLGSGRSETHVFRQVISPNRNVVPSIPKRSASPSKPGKKVFRLESSSVTTLSSDASPMNSQVSRTSQIVKETPSSSDFAVSDSFHDDDDSEAHDEDQEEDDDISLIYSKRRQQQRGRRHGHNSSSSGRSINRVRNPTRKLPAKRLDELLDDLFEAEDSIPGADDIELDQGLWQNKFFETIDHSGRNIIIMKENALGRMLRLVKEAKRDFQEFAAVEVADLKTLEEQYPKPRQLYEIEQPSLLRLLKILEHTTSACEDVRPVIVKAANVTATTAKPKPKAKTKKRKSVQDEEEPAGDEDQQLEADNTARADDNSSPIKSQTSTREAQAAPQSREEERAHFLQASVILARGCLAAECTLAMMSGSLPPKVILSEDAIQSALDPIRTVVESVTIPFVEAASQISLNTTGGVAFFSSINEDVAPQLSPKKKGKKAQAEPIQNADIESFNSASQCVMAVAKLFGTSLSALSGMQRLCLSDNVPLSDSVAITLVYLSLKPFFMTEPEGTNSVPNTAKAKVTSTQVRALDSMGGIRNLDRLRKACLSILRHIFSRQAAQRTCIIEEILTCLIKLPDMKKARKHWRISTGASVHPINALILQLIQSAATVTVEAGDSMIDLDDTARDIEMDTCDKPKPAKKLNYSTDGCMQAAQAVAAYLMQK